MAGRFLNKLPAAEIALIFHTSNPLPNYPARYSIAPTDQVLTVRFNANSRTHVQCSALSSTVAFCLGRQRLGL
ncbi:MAG TPA: hypothetical protein VMA53_06990 [Stellaceae bacterium]|nr:hypothetical protein [Stellaceae bacterium]